MSVAGITNTTPDASLSTAATGAVTKDEFLKLLVTQMQNQDPLKPDSDTAYVAQLAQFASLEQATNQTQILQSLGTQMAANAGNQSVDLVGHSVTARYDHVSLDGSGNGAPPLRFTLTAPAAKVTMTVTDSTGKVVRTLQTGPQSAGAQTIAWDGRSDAGLVIPAGNYRVNLSASDARGQNVSISSDVVGTVTGVSFASGQANVILDGSAQAQLADIVEVRR